MEGGRMETADERLRPNKPGKGGIFAIASSPTTKDGAFEFLIKEQPPSDWSPGTGWLTGASAGPGALGQLCSPAFISNIPINVKDIVVSRQLACHQEVQHHTDTINVTLL